MKPQVVLLTSFPQDHHLVLSVIDRLLEIGVNFTGFIENQVPDQFEPGFLDSKLILIDRGVLAKMNDEEKKMLEAYSRKHIVVCYDYCGRMDDRTLANFNSEIVVNGALSKADIEPGFVPEQSAELMCRFARERARAYLDSAGIGFNEFTLHSLRAVEKEKMFEILPRLYDAQDPEFIPHNHDVLGPWCYAPLCAKITGKEEYNKKFLHVLDRTMKARPYTKEGIMGGCGNVADPLNLKGEFPLYGAHCIGTEKVVYNEMFHFHGPVFAAAALASGERRYLNEAMKLFRHLRDFNTDKLDGIPSHYSIDEKRKGEKWSRGVAHILHGITLMFEVWPELPEPEASELIAYADSIGEGLLRYQDNSGLWHNIVDDADSPLETSGTMAFLITYKSLVKLGHLPESKYAEMLDKARGGLLRRCYRGGFAGNCSGTGLSISKDYYIRRPFNFLFTGQIVPALED